MTISSRSSNIYFIVAAIIVVVFVFFQIKNNADAKPADGEFGSVFEAFSNVNEPTTFEKSNSTKNRVAAAESAPELATGPYPKVLEANLLPSYPPMPTNGVSKKNSSDVWRNNPVLPLGSFKQITNNLRYNKNPDQGNCVRSEFCDTMYHDVYNKSNEVNPVVNADGQGVRVGFYRADSNALELSPPSDSN